ncbi:uncharacterized protein C2orf81 homolog [Dryobates pubescens]|uniref:uncharacterized protein C2orf81 homolog n=1 Tax=Dryobates pubescens TaxID=118200 RepID=UPI0023B911AE|nr:uncharacterized protein C2orf81 homolog [Dryobates pubescens]
MIPRERAATSKSRVDKPQQPVVATSHADVVSGLLPQDEWLSLLEAEQGDRDVGDTLAELLDRVMDGCLKADVAQQLVPFVVAQARDAILHIAQWRFLARDEGDSDLKDADGTWQEDEEPEPPTTDSWARGCVPTQRAHLSPGEGEVEVLDPKDKPLAHPYGARWHRRGSERGSSRLPQGSVPTRGTQLQVPPPGSSQPIGHLPQPLGSVRLAPGVTVRWDAGVKQEVEEDEKEEETEQSLRPIHPTVLLPAMATRQATGESKY